MDGLLLVCGWLGYGLEPPVPTLMFGWMVAWFVINSLMCVVVELEFLHSLQALVGSIDLGGHLELLPPDLNSGSERSRLYFSVPRPLQSVQRAELWGVIAALQASRPVHLGVDNANVVGHVGSILSGRKSKRTLELLVDGDLLALVQRLIRLRGPGTTVPSRRLRVMLMRAWFVVVGFGNSTSLVMTWPIKLQI